MAVIIAVGAYFGKYLDSKNSTDSLYTIIFSLISIFLALYYVFKKTINQNEKK
jgi:F0F1-type ATP synthase assembly protein I